MITELNHLTINVVDLDASLRFYGDILGLAPAGEIEMGDHTLTYFSLPGGCRLELICYAHPTGVFHPRSDTCGIYRHFCLRTDDLDGLFTRFLRDRVPVTKVPSYVEKLGCSTMLVVDPNGVEIELIA